jgi:predicted transposase YbfD/YdcC
VDISGATVTIDTMGRQKDLATAITSGSGDCYLAVM